MSSGLTVNEAQRKLIHVAVGGLAFLLIFLSWPQAALLAIGGFAFNWQVLPRIGGRALWRPDDAQRGYPVGILIYPLSVLGLVLWFHDELWKAAAVWGLLAAGDGMASLLGQALGGPRLPWNAGKSWTGFLAFVVCGGAAAAALIVWAAPAPVSSRVLALALPLAIVGALAESMPTRLDDNLTVPVAGALTLALLARAQPAQLLADPRLAERVAIGLMVNVAVAILAMKLRSIDRLGALAAILIGTLITAGTGLSGFALMAAFFVTGSSVTRLGYRIKLSRGIAQERGGARGWRNALANGGVPAVLAVMAGMSSDGVRELFTLAYAASVATAAADTCSSEIGKAYGRRTYLITTLRPVAPGTEGAVSLEGTLGGAAGGAAVALLGAGLGLYGLVATALVAVAGLLGSLAESIIGTFAEKRGFLDNDQLNALNTALGAAIAWALASGLRGAI